MGALSDVKVLDLSRLLPGGFCSLLLADFGADVLKVEDTAMGDYLRWAPPFYEGAGDSAASALFLALNRNKRSIRLNLKEEAGRRVLLALARDSDVLLESFRPGVLDLIKRLQEERFMPLKAIRAVLDDDPERAGALVELEDRILESALQRERSRTSAAEVRRRYGISREALERLGEIGILGPDGRGYSQVDVRIVEAISRFRAGGYDEQIGFTVYDTLRYKRALEELVKVKEEGEVVLERLAGELEPDRVVELMEAGAEPLRDFIAALHSKLLIEELRRHRESRR